MRLTDAVVYRLRKIMAEKNITPYYFHVNGGIAKSSISQLFNGKQEKVTLDFLYQFTSTLGMSLCEFFNDPMFDEVTD